MWCLKKRKWRIIFAKYLHAAPTVHSRVNVEMDDSSCIAITANGCDESEERKQ